MTIQNFMLEDFPLELLEMIVQSLGRSPKSLCSLAQTCRKFCHLAVPVLYTSVFLTNPVSCEKFARTIMRRPSLSSLVLELQVHYHNAQKDTSHEALFDVVSELQNLESLSLRSLPLYQAPEDTNKNHTLLGMLVQRKRNDGIESCTQYVGKRLRSLYLGAYSKDHHQSWWILGPNEVVFYMEKLEKLCIQGAKIERLHQKAFAANLPSKKTALKELVLLNCDVSSNTIAQILAFPEGLTHFTMKGQFPTPTIAFESSLNASNYIREIARSTPAGLEYLDFDIWNAETSSDLDCLDNLKHITVSPEAIHGYIMERDLRFVGRSLPTSLETLTVKDFNRDGLPVEILLGNLEDGNLPNLRTITYGTFYDEEDNDDREEDWGKEIEAFRELGVELSIVRYHDPSVMRENENWPCECWRYHHTTTMW